MKSVSELVKPNLVGSQPNYQVPTESSVEITPQAVAVMDKLFDHLTVICPAWHKSLPSDESVANFKTLWLEEIINAGIRNWRLLTRGLERCKQEKNPFLPSVGQFIEWCLAEDYQALGLPDEERIYRRISQFMAFGMEEVHRFSFTNNAEYWLITGLYQRNRAGEWSEKKLQEEIGKALKKMAERVKSGERIPEPKITLPDAVSVRPSDEVINRRFAELKAKMGIRQ